MGTILAQTNGGGCRLGVAMDVGQAFLQHAEENELAVARGAIHVVGDIGVNFNAAALGEALQKPSGGGGDASLVEQGRMQEIRGGADFLQGLVGESVEIIDEEFEVRGRGFGLPNESDGHFHGGEGLSGGVVQLAGNLAALIVLQRHEAEGKVAELVFCLCSNLHLRFQGQHSLRKLPGTIRNPLLEQIVRGLQCDLLPPVGVPQGSQHGADEKESDGAMQF